mmetsp:Transcript_25000/g.55443  ORF Transcript_25000/g.55443 Transcript_25000/m.55443 type:complete len:595 (+) Transcript_25000:201-1985(+)
MELVRSISRSRSRSLRRDQDDGVATVVSSFDVAQQLGLSQAASGTSAASLAPSTGVLSVESLSKLPSPSPSPSPTASASSVVPRSRKRTTAMPSLSRMSIGKRSSFRDSLSSAPASSVVPSSGPHIFQSDSADGVSCAYSYEVSLTPSTSKFVEQERQPDAARTTTSTKKSAQLDLQHKQNHVDDNRNITDTSTVEHCPSNDSEDYDSDVDSDSDSGASHHDDSANGNENRKDSDPFFTSDSKTLKGTVLAGRYRIIRELGCGTFGRVMECYEIDHTKLLEQVGLGTWRGTLRPKKSGIYAIKIIRNVERYIRDAEIEADLLRRVNKSGDRGSTLFPIVHDEFDLPSGTKCLVLEKLGMNLYDVIKKNDGEGFDTYYVREIAIQLFDALDHLHGIGIIHTDLKPENILLVSNNSDGDDVRIKIVDFGSAVTITKGSGAPKFSIVNTRQYRAPEVLLRIGWSFPSDIWAGGCLLAELALGCLLFPTRSTAEHLAIMEKKIGKFPRRILLRGKASSSAVASKYFDRMKGTHKMAAVLNEDSSHFVENECCSLKDELGEEAVETGLYDLLKTVLTLDPWFRPKAKKALALAMNIHEI